MKKIVLLLASIAISVSIVNAQDDGVKLDIESLVQTDGQTSFGIPKGFDELSNGLTMRRVQTKLKSQINDWLFGEISLNFANGEFQLKDAFIRYDHSWFDVKVGNFKEDFSVERTTSGQYVSFMERPMVVSAFAPGRHIGAKFEVHYNWLRTSLGISWQTIDYAERAQDINGQREAGFIQGSNITNKVVIMPWYNDPTKGLHIGFNWSYRAPNTANWSPTSFAYADTFSSRQNSSINRRRYLHTDVIQNVAYDMLYGAEFGGYNGGFSFMGEFIWNNTYMSELAENRNTKFFYGYYAQMSYLLFGGQHNYDSSQSEFKRPTMGRSWGDVELMARWDYLQLTDKKGEIYGGAGQNFTFGIVYYINKNLKAMLNYTYSRNDMYANGVGNTLIIGYDEFGFPTANPEMLSLTSIQGARFHTIGCRVELNF